MSHAALTQQLHGDEIAIVGMSIHVPGANTLDTYWANLRDGVPSIQKLDDAALLAAGESTEKIARANYVPYAAVLDGFDMFDADFFGFSPKEAAILDPQHRKFLELGWSALENAGHPPDSVNGNIGVYAGCGMGSYFYFNICSNPNMVDDVGMFLLRHTGNDKDFLSTRVSHLFDLNGPSINIQTACSTSLVATHYACQALRNGECEMALAGGVTIEIPHGRGYLFKENEILSPDGQCHAFDHRAQGTVFGSGAGVVALRRLSDAIADGDHIWAVIKGSAINNDGADKAGYLAPSVSGQAAAIAKAHTAAGISSDTLGYVECHGTGTYLGDPIEISALTQGFRETSDAVDFCRIGSVKTNIGHLDTAAGVASLVKTSLALHNDAIPPSLGYETPNPVIEFEGSPFRVNDTLSPWPSNTLRRAAVNSLGVGGTNAHLVLEEAPARPASDPSDWPFQVLTVSGRSKSALDANTAALADHLEQAADQPLADVAFTLKEGRKAFEHRRVLVASNHDEAVDLLRGKDTTRVFAHTAKGDAPDLVFMFPGGGAQHPDMARDLYETEPVFREWMDRGLEHLQPSLDYDLRSVWLPKPQDAKAAAKTLTTPSIQLPLIMMVEYALAQLWMSWGVQPTALVGHSMGENTAACVAGVISFEDCIDLVQLRGKLFDRVAPGGMLSVPLSVDDIAPMLNDDLDIACRNATDLTVISGPQAALDRFANTLNDKEIAAQRIQIDIAAHSKMLDPILPEFKAFLSKLDLQPPALPIISNRTGATLTAAEATDAAYWVGHLRNSVDFAGCLKELSAKSNRVYLEVGPGKALSSLAQMSDKITSNQVINSLRHPDQKIEDDKYFLTVIGRLWATGVSVDWDQIWGDAKRHRLPLPTYQFQQNRYFIEPGQATAQSNAVSLVRNDTMADWGYRPTWRAQYADIDIDETLSTAPLQIWLVFADETGLCNDIAGQLRGAGHKVVSVQPGDFYARKGDDTYQIAPEQGCDGYQQLVHDLVEKDLCPTRILHGWLITDTEYHRPGSSFFDRCKEHGLFSLTFLAQALAEVGVSMADVHCTTLTNGAARVHNEPLEWPEKAMIQGPAGVLPKEFPGFTCATLDVEVPRQMAPPTRFLRKRSVPTDEAVNREQLTKRIVTELLATPKNATIAFRGQDRLEQTYQQSALNPANQPGFKRNGTYLITGGLGGIGLSVASTLAQTYKANLILTSRSQLPEPADWDAFARKFGPNHKTSQAIAAIRAMEHNGATVMAVSADVADLDQMEGVLNAARSRFGDINGVIHAAGTIDDAPVLAKTHADIDAVLEAKVQGLRVLDLLFDEEALDLMVLCSSTSTVSRPAGQLDYVAANAYLNAFADSRSNDETRVVAVNWGVWADVGMAAKATMAQAGETTFPVVPLERPLLDTLQFDGSDAWLFSGVLDARTDWIVDQHRMFDGTAVMPGTGYIELIAQALAEHENASRFTCKTLTFISPLVVSDTQIQPFQVRLTPTHLGYDAAVETVSVMAGQQHVQTHATAQIMLQSVANSDRVDLAAISARTSRATTNGTWTSPQEAHLQFGPQWRVMQEMLLGQAEGLARMGIPALAQADANEGFRLHPALMDIATGWAVDLAATYSSDALWVPVSYGQIDVLRPLPETIMSWVRVNLGTDNNSTSIRFDITICDVFGAVCVEIEDFMMHRMDAQLDFASVPPAHAVRVLDDAAATVDLSPAQQRLAYNVSQGIRASEGADALERALALDLPQVIVSSLDLNSLRAQAEESAAQAKMSQTFERPEIDSDYAAPETETQMQLAQEWQSLLGLSQIGINDSFFDLGGHSLIAVRLFSSIKREFGVHLPISTLFEAPTIAECASMIDAHRDGPKAITAASSGPEPEFKFVVPMAISAQSNATPLFLVAGMFGNVLNLRQLAQLIGTDRPVYGLQARGLLGDESPHPTIQDAAIDYLSEIRQIQPDGPYHLGGFSGGGITAYEVAQQLSTCGETVASLTMLDTPLPVRATLTKHDKALIKICEIRKNGIGYLRKWIQDRVAWRRFEAEYETMEQSNEAFHDRAIEAAFLEAVGQYELQIWNGPFALIRPPLDLHWQVTSGRWVSQAKEYVYDDNGWTNWAQHIDIIEVPGDHDSMVLEPNVRALARHLANILNNADDNFIHGAVPEWVPATAAE